MKTISGVVVAMLMAISGSAQIVKGTTVEGTTTTVKGQGIYCGDVEMKVTKAADGINYLYDKDRKISVLIAAPLPSLDSLAAQGLLYDKIYVDGQSTDDAEAYIQSILGKYSKNIDVSQYLEMAEVGNSKSDFHGYRLKSITISQMKTAEGLEYPAAATQPLYLRVACFHPKNRWSSLYDIYRDCPTATPISIADSETYDRWAVIPEEGATLVVDIVPNEDAASRRGSKELTKLAHFQTNFVPNESGVTEIDADGLKATINYERSASPLVDAYTAMVNIYDYYKNTFGRQSFDGQGEPVYLMTYLPGGEAAPASDIDMPFPRFVYNIEQSNAFATSDYYPYVIVSGTGGLHLEGTELIRLLPLVERSMMCHEFTHLVTKTTAKLSSSETSEGAALNESFSDIMAISMMKTSEYGYGPDTPWIVGGKGLALGKSNLRNLADPKASTDGLTPQPDTYEGQYWENTDKYIRMGVQNKFYYLLCEGGKGTNDKQVDYDVTGIGIEKGVQIAYLTLTKYCSPESNFSNIRESWLKAAQELHGENSIEAQTVAQAWTAVGIEGSSPTGINTVTVDDKSDDWYRLDGQRLTAKPTAKGVFIHNGRKIVNR